MLDYSCAPPGLIDQRTDHSYFQMDSISLRRKRVPGVRGGDGLMSQNSCAISRSCERNSKLYDVKFRHNGENGVLDAKVVKF